MISHKTRYTHMIVYSLVLTLASPSLIILYTESDCGVTERPRGAIFSCFRGNRMGYHGNVNSVVALIRNDQEESTIC